MLKTNEIPISAPEQLWRLARSVNIGNKEAAKAIYRMENDINLGGKRWEPIGTKDNPFCGSFDGAGFTVSNFKVPDSADTGLFGKVADADIFNLNVIATTYKSRKKLMLFVLILLLTVSIIGSIIMLNRHNTVETEAPFVMDKNQKQDKNDTAKPREDGNQLSYNFSKTVSFNGENGSFYLKNKGASNHIITVEIQISDSELLAKTGKTGRTQREIDRMENTNGYDPDKLRLTIAKTDGVEPGYYLTDFKMQKLPDGNYLPQGEYSGIALLKLYDINTHEMSILNSELAINIVVN